MPDSPQGAVPDHRLFLSLSPLNPMGVKGAGEAGAIPVGPLFAQALEDALHDVDFEILEIPLNSNRLWELVSGK